MNIMDIQNGIKIGQASGSTFGDWINILIISNYPLGRGRNLSVIPQATIFWPLAKSVRLNIRDPKLKKKIMIFLNENYFISWLTFDNYFMTSRMYLLVFFTCNSIMKISDRSNIRAAFLLQFSTNLLQQTFKGFWMRTMYLKAAKGRVSIFENGYVP